MTSKKGYSSVLCSTNTGHGKPTPNPLQSSDYRELYNQLSLSSRLAAKSRTPLTQKRLSSTRGLVPPKRFHSRFGVPSLAAPSSSIPASPPPVITLSMPQTPPRTPDLDIKRGREDSSNIGKSSFLAVPGFHDEPCFKAKLPDRPDESEDIHIRPPSRRGSRNKDPSTNDRPDGPSCHLPDLEMALRRVQLSEMLLRRKKLPLLRVENSTNSRSVTPSAKLQDGLPCSSARLCGELKMSPSRSEQPLPPNRKRSPLACGKPARHSGLCTYVEVGRDPVSCASAESVEDRQTTPTKWRRHRLFNREISDGPIQLHNFRLTSTELRKGGRPKMTSLLTRAGRANKIWTWP